jgi:RNA polymerase sigma-70 factor (ECF subfamily)
MSAEPVSWEDMIRTPREVEMAPDHTFETVYAEYHPKILRYLTQMVGSVDAEDVAQEVFDRVHRGLRGFQGKSSLSTWIYRIATNAAIDRSRSASYRYEKDRKSYEDQTIHEPSGAMASPTPQATERLLIRKEMSDCIKEFIDALPPNYKAVLVLSDLEGLASREIAEILSITEDNAKVRLHRARARLKEALKNGCDFYYTEENALACDRKPVQILPDPPKKPPVT